MNLIHGRVERGHKNKNERREGIGITGQRQKN
jgi:hypothetical protein